MHSDIYCTHIYSNKTVQGVLILNHKWMFQSSWSHNTAAAAAKSLQSCPSLCDPIDSSPPGSPIPGILQARTLEWVAYNTRQSLKIMQVHNTI